MKRLPMLATFIVAALGLLAGFSGAAAADTINPNPITFESSQGYVLANINGQQSWSNTGSYDANVVSTSLYGFGQALQISDATTSGSFGDQTFSPGLAQPAGEAPAQTHFQASFTIGSATGSEQTGQHVSISPDNGSGGRMSYLRFEDQSTGIHVFFDQATDPSFGTTATFTDEDIATLSYTTAHTVGFALDFKPGPANDVVTITIDGSVVKTGTTWEDYYRYDPEQIGNGNVVPLVSKLLFKEGGTNNPGNVGNGYLIDAVSLASTSPTCTPTGFVRDNINLTAAQIGGNVNGTLNASGCNIGVYYDNTHTGSVSGAEIYGANYFGVFVNGDLGAAKANVTGSTIHDIGESPLNGTQHGNAIYYRAFGGTASGTVSGNTLTNYQKGGITVNGNVSTTITNNTVTGQGPVSYIAQNGIQVGYGAKATVTGNNVTGNAYTGANLASSAGILVVGGACYGLPATVGLDISKNTLTGNDVGVWLFNAAANCVSAPTTKTNNSVKFNTISNSAVTNTTGFSGTCGYQAGVSDLGKSDLIVNNTISGPGYTPVSGDCSGTPHAFLRFIDAGSSAHGVSSNK